MIITGEGRGEELRLEGRDEVREPCTQNVPGSEGLSGKLESISSRRDLDQTRHIPDSQDPRRGADWTRQGGETASAKKN